MTSDQALDTLVNKLVNVKKTKDGYKASCPLSGHTHGDEDPSLSISIGENGEILTYCFSQHEKCYEDVLNTVGLSKADMRVNKTDDSFDKLHTAPRRTEPKRVREVTGHERIHPYREKDGTKTHAIGISRRPSGKSIGIPYTMDTTGRGGALMYWEGDPYLYNLDHITNSNAKTAYIPEGEQDCDTLTALGKLATTNPFGAGSCLNVDYSPLGGKDNVVLFDNDHAGRVRAQKVANALHPISNSVKVVELPGLNEGGDITDWVEAGHTVEELDTLVNDAPLWEPAEEEEGEAPEDDDGFESARINFDGFFTKERTEQKFLVEPLWPLGRSISIVAKHKQGKSLLAGEMAFALATGRAFLGRPAGDPIKVMYLDLEMTEDDLWERLQSMGYNETDEYLLQQNLMYYSLPSLPKLDTEEGGLFLIEAVTNHQIAAVIIDTASRVVKGEENSNDTWKDLHSYTLQKLKAQGISIARLDHLGKDASKGARGGSSKGDDVDVQWTLTSELPRVTLQTKGISRLNWVPSTVELERKEEPTRHTWTGRYVVSQAEIDAAKLLDRLKIPTDLSRRKVRSRLKEMKDAGEVTEKEAEMRDLILSKAIKIRKNRLSEVGTTLPDTVGTTTGTKSENPSTVGRNQSGTSRNQSPLGMGTRFTPYGGTSSPTNCPGCERQRNQKLVCINTDCNLFGADQDVADAWAASPSRESRSRSSGSIRRR